MPPQSTQLLLPLQSEEWHPLVGWEGWYEVSDLGRVRRIAPAPHGGMGFPGRLLKSCLLNTGYLVVHLSREGKSKSVHVHRAVAEAFLGPCPVGHEVNHRNGIKADNRMVNLEWATASRNTRHAFATGLYLPPRGEGHANTKLTEADVLAIRAAAGKIPGKDLARQYGVSPQTISRVLHRESWKHLAGDVHRLGDV